MPDVGGEDHADVGAGANFESIGGGGGGGGGGGDDPFEGDHESLAVVADRGGHAGCDDQLDSVGSHIGTDQGHVECW